MIIKKRIPLLKNHHTHPSIFAAFKNGFDLGPVTDRQEALAKIGQLDQDFNLVLGWNNIRYGFEQDELDKFSPLLICNVSFHEFLLNKPARAKFLHHYPEVIENIDNPDWVERNLHMILKFIAGTADLCAKDIKIFFQDLAKQGAWFAEDKLLPGQKTIDLYKQSGCYDKTLLWADLDSYDDMDESSRNGVFGIKIFLDGAVGAKTAALKQGYSSGEKGLLLHTDKELYNILEKITIYNRPVSIHSIGDMATEQLISALERLEQNTGKLPCQVRIEHCQFISLAMARRARALGAILSMQPNFSEDSVQYRDRISSEYCNMNNNFRMLIDQAGFVPGQNMFFGTDGPPHGIDYALTTSLFAPLETQRLSLDEFIQGYCLKDFDHGHIDIELDMEENSVQASVILAD